MIELPPAPAWLDDAACRQTDAEAFFPEGHSAGHDAAYAKRVCGGCPLHAIIGCAKSAVEANKDFHIVGVWAGRFLPYNSRSRDGALRDIHAIAGVPYEPSTRPTDTNWPRPCVKCHRQMRQRNTSAQHHPGTVKHRSDDYCDTCYKARATGEEPRLTKAVPA